MNLVTASEARTNLYLPIDESAASRHLVIIERKRNSAVPVSIEDWASTRETLYLTSIPETRESILEGLLPDTPRLMNN